MVTCSMCIPVRVKNVPPKSGTDDQMLLDGVIFSTLISLVHSIACNTVNAAPKNMVASSQLRTQGLSPRFAARTASTMVSELDSKQAVITVALAMLSLWKGVGHGGCEMRPELYAKSRAPKVSESEAKNSHIPIFLE